jgi:predicted nucleic acid-binding Zn ribbon protein
MPIYEYRRPDGTTFELQQSFTEEPLRADPETGVPVERVLHAPAVHFKGKGFYSTDYGTRRRERETRAAAEGSDSASSNGSSGSKPEGKQAATDGAAKDGSAKGGAAKDGSAKGGEGSAKKSSAAERV